MNTKHNGPENIYVIVCSGISDIGKGWLTASIGGLAPKTTLVVKIDPLLNLAFPAHLGVEIKKLCRPSDVEDFVRQGRAESGDFKISEDFLTYASRGLEIFPECNIVSGDLIRRFLLSENPDIRKGEIKKRTFNDLSRFLAGEITDITRKRNLKTLLIEVGGTIEDNESIYIPGAIRFLGKKEFLGVTPGIVLLTYFDYAEPHVEGAYRVKTQYARCGIVKVHQAYYGLPLKACFVRRRNVPLSVPDEVLKEDLKNVAYETQVGPGKTILLPNVQKENIHDITDLIKQTGLFTI